MSIEACRFDKCPVCLCDPFEIKTAMNEAAGQMLGEKDPIQAIGHLTAKAGIIHAMCLPCFQSSVLALNNSRGPRLACPPCPICREKLSDSEDSSECLRLKNFSVLPANGLDGDVQSVVIGEVIKIVDNVKNRSRIEAAGEVIGRELFGRALSLVVGMIVGGAVGVNATAFLVATPYVVLGGRHLLIPSSEYGGTTPMACALIGGAAVGGICGGITEVIRNPFGDMMGKAGALTGRAIVRGLDSLDELMLRMSRSWHNSTPRMAADPAV